MDGLIGNFVDDFFHGGNERFQELTPKTMDAFESKPREWENVEFVGVTIKTLNGPLRFFTVSHYEKFVAARAEFAWLAHSRPHLCCAVYRAAQVMETSFCDRHVQEMNKSVKYAKATKSLVQTYGPLDREMLHLRVDADASFANNDNLTSQLGYVVLLRDGANRCHVLVYSSKKARRVVRSIMAGEVYAFSDEFDAAFILKHDL